jgi:hypothetical protein
MRSGMEKIEIGIEKRRNEKMRNGREKKRRKE